jgi:hypothetical protein
MDPNVQTQPQSQNPAQASPNPVQNSVLPALNSNIATPPVISFGREGGPVQTVVQEDEDKQNLSQPFLPPIENDVKQAVQANAPQQGSEAKEDAIKTNPQAEADKQKATQVVSAQESHVVNKEILQPSTPETAPISKELAHIIEQTSGQDRAFLSPEVIRSGVMHASEAVPVPQNSFGISSLPMSYPDSVEMQKKTKLHEAIRWLSGRIAYQWRKINPSLYKEK